MSDKPGMAFDTLVSNAGRLEILTALAVEETQDFVTLRKRTRLTDGNLASHAKRLQTAGLIQVNKAFREGKPVTSFHLTSDGRRALEQHVRRLMSALSQRRIAPAPEVVAEVAPPDDVPAEAHDALVEAAVAVASVNASPDDWVD
jgi:DNA-binding MarR family transcriptional regulator